MKVHDPPYEEIVLFAETFGEPHVRLAMHAAFPLGITPELIHLIRINFVPDAPWIAEADFLLSPFCKDMGGGFYEIDEGVKEVLFDELKQDADFGRRRVLQLANFLHAYVAEEMKSIKPGDLQDFMEAQNLVALSWINPSAAAEVIAEELLKRTDLEVLEKSKIEKITNLTQTLSEPLLQEDGLLMYAAGLKYFAHGQTENAANSFNEIEWKEDVFKIGNIELRRPEIDSSELHSQENLEEKPGDEDRVFQIFISYSHHDEKYKQTIVKFLAPLTRDTNIHFWSDEKIRLGWEWDDEIRKAFDRSDMILLLLSADYLNSDYSNRELAAALAKHTRNEALVIPIKVRECYLDSNPELTSIQSLPRDGRFISEYENKDLAYTEIAQQLSKIIDEMAPNWLSTGGEKMEETISGSSKWEPEGRISIKPECTIIYSHEDVKYGNELMRFISPLRSSVNFNWNEYEVPSKVVRNKEANELFERSHLIIILVSADFLDSNFEVFELPDLLSKHEKNETTVVPIFVRPCFIHPQSALKKIQGFPKENQFISTVDDRDREYTTIVKHIAGLLAPSPKAESPSKPYPKQIFLALTSKSLERRRLSILFELEGKSKYEDWPYQVVPNQTELSHLMKMDSKEQRSVIKKYIDESMYSVHLIDNNDYLIDSQEEESLELSNFQFDLARRKSEESSFKCIVSIQNEGYEKGSEYESRLLKKITKESSTNSNVIQLTGSSNSHIIDTLDSLIYDSENETRSLELKKSIMIMYVFEDRQNSYLKQVISFLVDRNINVIRPLDLDRKDYLDIREYERENLKECAGVIVFYSHGNDLWFQMKLNMILKTSYSSKRGISKLVIIDEPNKEEKFNKVDRTSFEVIYENDDLREKLVKFLKSL